MLENETRSEYEKPSTNGRKEQKPERGPRLDALFLEHVVLLLPSHGKLPAQHMCVSVLRGIDRCVCVCGCMRIKTNSNRPQTSGGTEIGQYCTVLYCFIAFERHRDEARHGFSLHSKHVPFYSSTLVKKCCKTFPKTGETFQHHKITPSGKGLMSARQKNSSNPRLLIGRYTCHSFTSETGAGGRSSISLQGSEF